MLADIRRLVIVRTTNKNRQIKAAFLCVPRTFRKNSIRRKSASLKNRINFIRSTYEKLTFAPRIPRDAYLSNAFEQNNTEVSTRNVRVLDNIVFYRFSNNNDDY